MCCGSGGWSLGMAIQELTRWRRVAKSLKEATFHSQVLQMNADQEVTEVPAEISKGPVDRIVDPAQGLKKSGRRERILTCDNFDDVAYDPLQSPLHPHSGY
ncbi:hypothetical protein NDU88_011278 [Pleurodeles waltl]|uniref:Uncharacterized protein n=1 Tax=Pleurodeles waltl TaxID=8319 RepID=A0AAV7S4F9_PLEWA|nr:hypothetical protein NDU88_011278 [Pleurodeles waltl]